MKKELKLNCPMCDTEFITTRRDKVWCKISCSIKFQNIKHSIMVNKSTQQNMKNESFIYDLELNKFYLKSMMNEKTYIRMEEERTRLRRFKQVRNQEQ